MFAMLLIFRTGIKRKGKNVGIPKVNDVEKVGKETKNQEKGMPLI